MGMTGFLHSYKHKRNMSGLNLSLVFPLFVSVLVICLFHCCNGQNTSICAPSSCGNITITSPFRLSGQPQSCGFKTHELACENNQTILYFDSGKYYVYDVNYSNRTIRLADAGVARNSCSSMPRSFLNAENFTDFQRMPWQPRSWNDENLGKTITYLSCANPVKSDLYIETAPCVSFGRFSYVMVGGNLTNIENNCRVELMVMSSFVHVSKNMSFVDVYNGLVYGFELLWYPVICYTCRGDQICDMDNGYSQDCSTISFYERLKSYITDNSLLYILAIGSYIVAKTMFGSPFVFAFLIYTWTKRHLSMDEGVEEFLQKQNELIPVRYSYSEIKKMTNNFRDKLGQGGYGSVYKGKLRSGHFAAIKILGQSNANGQDFMNEVATIGRIHHVNVVRLIGFCAERSKRALVYDFMPNGSLDKYVFSRQGPAILSWENMHAIALGVASGIEYLHRGCEMQILHFDIKPHNILLNENFTPKVSDFGLAKLQPSSDNTVKLTAARGTIGYIAPELFYKNIGRITYKADVYSFGMLLLEMAGKRNNRNADAQHSSQAYFPSWVYNEVTGGEVEIADATAEGKKLAKKMVIVGLWCIQMNPNDRPAMNRVVEMLEGEVEALELPPMPLLFPEETSINDSAVAYSDGTWTSSTRYDDSTETSSLLQRSD